MFNEICNSSWFLWTTDWQRQRLKTFRHVEYQISNPQLHFGSAYYRLRRSIIPSYLPIISTCAKIAFACDDQIKNRLIDLSIDGSTAHTTLLIVPKRKIYYITSLILDLSDTLHHPIQFESHRYPMLIIISWHNVQSEIDQLIETDSL